MATLATSSSSSAAAASVVGDIQEGPITRERGITSDSTEQQWVEATEIVSKELNAEQARRAGTAAGASERETQLEAFLAKAKVATSSFNQGIQP